MRLCVQRCSYGSVKCRENCRKIGPGLVILVGFTEGDSLEQIVYLAKKVAYLRIFPDEEGMMNRNVMDVGGSILSISQFTLYADTKKGHRPSYQQALNSEEAQNLYQLWNEELKKYVPIETGFFKENMQVTIHNEGPTTILLER